MALRMQRKFLNKTFDFSSYAIIEHIDVIQFKALKQHAD